MSETIPILVHLTPDDRMKLDEMAREAGTSRADFIRGLIRFVYADKIKTQSAGLVEPSIRSQHVH